MTSPHTQDPKKKTLLHLCLPACLLIATGMHSRILTPT